MNAMNPQHENAQTVTSMTMIQALRSAMDIMLERDDDVVVFGQDVGYFGGVFRCTEGLQKKYGTSRVFDAPISESGIIGAAVGMGAYGLRPVVEIQFADYVYPASDQLISEAARLRYRSAGDFIVPMTVRMPCGGGIYGGQTHSQSPEAMFTQVCGLRTVMPSNPYDAKGLLIACIENDDPVIFLEPTRLYRMNPQPLADDARRLPLDSCFTLREGGDLTLVSWGASVHETQQAAERLAQRGIEAEVIDVACLKPLDLDTLEASVRKTGRCVIVHEAPKSGGLGGEIAASLYERVLFDLRAPIQRVAAADIPPPLYRLEALYMPAVEDILAACDTVLGYA